MVRTRIPFLRVPCFLRDGLLHFQGTHATPDDPIVLDLIQAVFDGGATTEDLARIVVERGAAPDVEAARTWLHTEFQRADALLADVEVDLPERVDVLLVEQGYGGVYVHTVELLKELRKRWSCLLLSPVSPLFEIAELPEVITLELLHRQSPSLSYFDYVQILRTIVKRTAARLLLIMHRSQSLFLFDVIAGHRTVIYCDGYYDGMFRYVHQFHLEASEQRRREVLAELYYVLANGVPGFYGMTATPKGNVYMLMAGAYSLTGSVENWCWGAEQYHGFVAAFPQLRASVRLMLPFTNPRLFAPTAAPRERTILFTTTMHNIEAKGFPELVAAMKRLPTSRTRCVVRQPQRLPKIAPSVARRMQIGPVPKSEMIDLYHRLWVNCRVSRTESSPLSILEAMICELPQIVSPMVASQIPIIEDGTTGFVVDPDDGDRLVWALSTILRDRSLRDRMGRECRRRAETLSFEQRAHEFERLLA